MAGVCHPTTAEVNLFLQNIKKECSNDSLLIAKKLIELNFPLSSAVNLKDVTVIEYMLDNGYGVDEVYAFGTTPLMKAIRYADFEIAKLLVDRGANLEARNRYGDTPMKILLGYSFDFSNEKFKFLDFLLARGAKMTTEYLTFWFGNANTQEKMEMLIKYTVDWTKRTSSGLNLVYMIAGNIHFDPVDILRGQKLEIKQSNYRKNTALMRAANVGNVKTVEYLLSKGAEVNATDNKNHTALLRPFKSSIKRQNQHLKSIELLLEYGADPQYEGCHEIFKVVLKGKKFTLIEPYLAYLALRENLGVEIREEVYENINSHLQFKNHFECCKREIQTLKKKVVYHSVTLFTLLMVTEQRMIKYAYNDELLSKLNLLMSEEHSSKSYYYNLLRRRTEKVMRVVPLRKIVFNVISEICKLKNNAIIIGEIIDYLNIDDLKIIAQV